MNRHSEAGRRMPTEQRHRDGNGTEAWAPEKQIWVFWVIHKARSMVIHAA